MHKTKKDNNTHPPLNRLTIEVTTRCNGACLYCFAQSVRHQNKSLPIADVRQMLVEGYNLGCRHLHLTGGEPLCWGPLFDAMDHAFDTGYEKVFLNTNGTLITKEISKTLGSYKGLSISITLQGPGPFHDGVRGNGTYRQTVRGIKQVLDTGIDLLLFSVIYKSLIPVLPRFIQDVYENYPGIRVLVLIQLIRTMDMAFDFSMECLGPDDFIRLVQLTAFHNLYGQHVDILNNPLAIAVSRLMGLPWISQSIPLRRPDRLAILADGSIALSHSGKGRYGQYKPGEMKNVLLSRSYQNRVSKDRTTCPSCDHLKRCRDAGMVHPSDPDRDMESKNLYCKRVMERACNYITAMGKT